MNAKRILALILSLCMTLTVATFPVMAEEPTAEHTHHEETVSAEITLEEPAPEDANTEETTFEETTFEETTFEETTSEETTFEETTSEEAPEDMNYQAPAIEETAEAVTADTTLSNGLVYSVSNDEVTITDYTGSATEVIIPSTIEGCPVTSIGDEAFFNCSAITSITLPDNLTTIGNSAFYECSALKSISLPDSVTTIGGDAFYKCSALKSISLPDSVTTIGGDAFYECRSLTSVTIGDSVTLIGSSAFFYCTSLTSVTIPDSVTLIGRYAFEGCSSLTSVTIGEGVTSIGSSAFGGCRALTSVTIPDNVTSIGSYAFSYCTSLTSVTIPDSVTSIGGSAFYDCKKLQNVYYVGTKEQKDNISIDDNPYLTNAIWHYFDSVCDSECNDCGEIREVSKHDYSDRCDADCNVCSEVRIPPHVYDNPCDADCNACGELREPDPHFVNERDYEIVNDNSYPFAFSDGWYTSTNKLDGKSATLTLIANGDFTLNVRYKVSSEPNADYLSIKKNGASLVNNASGNVLETTLRVTLTAGDVLVFTYKKDGSVSNGTDTASFTFEPNKVNAEEVEADCSNAVVCLGCGIIVKPVDPNRHVYDKSCDAVCALCGATRDMAPVGITASKESAGTDFAPEKAIDKITSTGYKTSASFSSSNGGQSLLDIVFDFGKPVNLTEMYTQWGSCYMTKGAVYGANTADATEWTLLCTITNPTYEKKDYGNGATMDISHEGYYRYIKLCPTELAAGGRVLLYEASFKGDIDRHVYTNDLDYKCNECGYERFLPTSASNFKYSTNYNGTGITITGYYGVPTTLVIPTEINGLPVTAIGERAFAGCSTLRSIYIPEGVTYIYTGAFQDCTALTSIVIPEGVIAMQGYIGVFSGCTSLASVTLPSTLTAINDGAFSGCIALASINIPDSVTSIGSSAFYNCTSLTSITIPDSVTSIGDSAFSNCTSLTSITIPDSVTSIGGSAFSNCTSLTSITIPDSVTSIGNWAFSYCTSLTSITIPDSVVTIGSYAFSGLPITSVFIPAGVKKLSPNAFDDCDKLTEIVVDETNELYTSVDGVLYNKSKTVLLRAPITMTGEYDVLDTAIEIGEYAFMNCSGITSVTIPASVDKINPTAFSGCTALNEIVVDEGNLCYSFADGVLYNKDKTVLAFCLYGVSGHVNIPDTVNTIASYAFYPAPFVTSITLPISVTRVERSAFENHSLRDVYYYGTAEQREEIIIEDYNWGLTGARWHSAVCDENGGHAYDNACDAICNVCGETRNVSNHVFGGRCDPDCNACGKVTEVFADHIYDDDTDVRCNECGYIRIIENAPMFVVDSKTAKVGDTFTVAVSTKNNAGIVSIKLKVGYDAEVLELVSIEEGDFAETTFGAIGKNPITVLWEDVLSENNTTNGTVALLTFKVKDTAKAGTTEITVTYDPEDVYDYDMNNVDFAVKNSAVTIIEYISGDINNDGVVNNKDLGVLRRWLNEWEVDIVELAADVNRDGKVNNKDLGILRRYLNDWDVELK